MLPITLVLVPSAQPADLKLDEFAPINNNMPASSARPGVDRELRLLSFNMQVGIGTSRYRDYVLRGWRNVLPSVETDKNLGRIGQMLADYDIVGLQEIDAGSRRSGYQNQLQMLAEAADFDYWHIQVNRDMGRMAQHGLGLLSRFEPYEVTEHDLPGRIRGRGALMAKFGNPNDPLVVIITHLALTARTRIRQIAYLHELSREHEHVILMGDTNCDADTLKREVGGIETRLRSQPQKLATYPSWKPRRGIDHILVSGGIEVSDAQALDVQLSDHLPVAMQVVLPGSVQAALTPAG